LLGRRRNALDCPASRVAVIRHGCPVPGDAIRQVSAEQLARRVASGHSVAVASAARCRRLGPWSTKAGIIYGHAPAAARSRVIALRLQLHDSRADNGRLRVIPGTHERGVLTDAEIAAPFMS
jgi:hypothetical protein